MKKLQILALMLFTALISNATISLAETSGQDTAKKLVDKALAYVKEKGKDEAIKAFHNPKGGFIDGEYYVIMYSFDGTCLANGQNQKIVGSNRIEITDSEGKLYVKEFIDKAKSSGEGWVDYKWLNKTTKKIEDKSTYVHKVDGMDALIGCGYYKR